MGVSFDFKTYRAIETIQVTATYKIGILVVELLSTSKCAEGALVAAQDHRKQDDYLKTPTKFTETSAQS